MLKFDVVVHDTSNDTEDGQETREVRRLTDVSATKARRVAIRAMRRGVRLYGGVMRTHNWGSVGGRPDRKGFRSATIYPTGQAPSRSAAIGTDFRGGNHG